MNERQISLCERKKPQFASAARGRLLTGRWPLPYGRSCSEHGAEVDRCSTGRRVRGSGNVSRRSGRNRHRLAELLCKHVEICSRRSRRARRPLKLRGTNPGLGFRPAYYLAGSRTCGEQIPTCAKNPEAAREGCGARLLPGGRLADGSEQDLGLARPEHLDSGCSPTELPLFAALACSGSLTGSPRRPRFSLAASTGRE